MLRGRRDRSSDSSNRRQGDSGSNRTSTLDPEPPIVPSKAHLTRGEPPIVPAKAQLTTGEPPIVPSKAHLTRGEPPIVPSKAHITRGEPPIVPSKAQVTRGEPPIVPSKAHLTRGEPPIVPSKAHVTRGEPPIVPSKAHVTRGEQPESSKDKTTEKPGLVDSDSAIKAVKDEPNIKPEPLTIDHQRHLSSKSDLVAAESPLVGKLCNYLKDIYIFNSGNFNKYIFIICLCLEGLQT